MRGDILCRLSGHIVPALEAAGGTREVNALLHPLPREGTRGEPQQKIFAEGRLSAVCVLTTSQNLSA